MMMTKAKIGDKVKVHVTGKIEGGSVFADSSHGEPLQFEIGQSKIMRGIQDAIIGMGPNEQRTAKIRPDEGYGAYRKELIQEVNKDLLQKDAEYETGKTVKLPLVNGELGDARVLDVSDSTVTLDLNHPLAGKNLVFDISLLEIL